jgi:replicative DNA helicase
LRRQGLIAQWHDRLIPGGTDFAKEIDARLDSADIVLLLVSPDFIASDYCWDKEMSRALDRYDAGLLKVIPVIVRPCEWVNAPFGRLQAFPTDGKPITTWTNSDEGWLDVTKGIRTAVEGIRKKRKRSTDSRGFQEMNKLLSKEVNRVDAAIRSERSLLGMSTGLVDLDGLISGLQPSNLAVIAGRSGVGKSTLALNIASNVAIGLKVPVAFLSMEMSAEEITRRLTGSVARIDSDSYRSGRLIDEEWRRLTSAVILLNDAPLFIDDAPHNSIENLRQKLVALKAQHGLGLAIIDYLQMMEDGNSPTVAQSLKVIARELKIAIVAISQVSRQVDQRVDRRPQLTDLQDSGALENAADTILFLYRDDYYNQDSSDGGVAEIIVAKQRNGPLGTVRVVFISDFGRFENLYAR